MRTLFSETRQKEAEEAGGAGQVRLRPGAHGRGVPPWQRRILPDGKISCWMKHLHRIAHLSHSVWRSPSWSFEKVKSKDWNRKYLFETAKIWETLEQSRLIRWDNKPSQSKGFIPPSWIGTFSPNFTILYFLSLRHFRSRWWGGVRGPPGRWGARYQILPTLTTSTSVRSTWSHGSVKISFR